MSIYIGGTHIKDIYIGTRLDYSAMQGPAPDGFHVPLTTEWKAVYDIWTALGGGSSDGTNFGIALKLPFAGNRNYGTVDVYNQGTDAYYWSSTAGITNYAHRLGFDSDGLYPQIRNYRSLGFSVRCFKDTPTIPTSSWTKLYGTSIEAGGIFWSSIDGLISLSSDGQTWITIMDKNLGATQVWNSGDTLSEANCGKYYQRGNNYGFPRTGTIANQSTTQVDASNYGPGNYYSSDTFIKNNLRWDSTDNRNLWGGVTGVVRAPAKVSEVYVGTTKIRPVGRLPAEYQEVEYIESSGTQLIDTGYMITPNTEVAVDYQFTNANSQDFCFGIGSDSITSSGVTFCVYIGVTSGGDKFKAGISDGANNNTWRNYFLLMDTNRHTFVLNNGHSEIYNTSGTLEGSINTIETITRTAGHSFGLFCWWRTDLGTPARSNITAAKLYGCKIKESGTLQKNFIPCYRKADGEIGLYDLVNDQFYTNAGTGTFTKGPDVN